MRKQKAFRLYPENFSGNSLGELNDMLKTGWTVKHTLPEHQRTGNDREHTFHVLILEKTDEAVLTITASDLHKMEQRIASSETEREVLKNLLRPLLGYVKRTDHLGFLATEIDEAEKALNSKL